MSPAHPELADLYPEGYTEWRRSLNDSPTQSPDLVAEHPDYRGQHSAWAQTCARLGELWPALAALPHSAELILGDEVAIGEPGQLGPEGKAQLETLIAALAPWKKGPFSLFGRKIDSEWRSELKWQRLLPHLPPLAGARIADVGCNNGYFMLRMLAHDPKLIVGFEPFLKHAVHHVIWQQLARGYREKVAFEPMGIQHLSLWPSGFEVIFCLGILYHHTDPVGMLRQMAVALAKKGTIIIDCQGIAGDDEVCLVPKQRYAGAAGIWFLPTLPALKNWLRRAGFSHCRVLFDAPLSPLEQRRSKDAAIDSLASFLSADGQSTVEGYPPPRRFYLAVRR